VAAEQGPRGSFDADDTLEYVDSRSRRLYRQAWAVTAIAIYLAYLVYRGAYTINPNALIFSLAVYLAEVHGLFSLIFFYFQVWTLRRRRVRVPQTPLRVDVFITTYNEDPILLRQTVRAAINMRHRHRTFVLDDGRRPAVRSLCLELGCDYLTRPDNQHAKAGNWNHAFQQTDADVIATFDADHVPRADFLERTLGFFDDERVALVQVPQRYHNLDSLQHRVNWKDRRLYGEQDVFFNLVMPGKDHWNASFFCGTGAVLRRKALEPLGGLLTHTITEDMHTSLALQAHGWKTVYLNEMLVTGLAPMDFASYTSQRLRWAEGNLKIIRDINPLNCQGLSFAQRVCYFASLYHWTIGFPKIVFYLAPPIILITGQFPIAGFGREFMLVYGVHLLSLIASYKVTSRGTGRLLMDELFNMANCFTLLIASKRFLLGRGAGTFVVTSKHGGEGGDEAAVLPHYVLLTVSLMALVWSWLGLGFGVTDDWVGVGVASFWALYNLALSIIVVGFASRPRQKRQGVRFRAAIPVEMLGTSNRDAVGVTLDVSERGCTMLWPDTIPVGTSLPLRLHFGAHAISCTGVVRSNNHRKRSSWIAHGVEFDAAHQSIVDALADGIYNMTVPETFVRLSQPSWIHRQARALVKLARYSGRSAARREATLPVRVTDASGEFLATARDLSASGLSLVAPRPIHVGTSVRVRMCAGREQWDSVATVVRAVPLRSPRPDFATWELGLRLSSSDVGALESMLLEEVA